MLTDYSKRMHIKKHEIVQIALVIIGVLIVVRTIETLFGQVTFMGTSQGVYDHLGIWIAVSIVFGFLLVLFAYLMIRKSAYLAKRIIKEENESAEMKCLSRLELLNLSIIIMSLFFLIGRFPSFILSVYNLLSDFIIDFCPYQNMYINNFTQVLQYIMLLLIFLNAKHISIWIERKLFK